MIHLAKFSKIPKGEWLHSKYISSIYDLYVLKNPFLGRLVDASSLSPTFSGSAHARDNALADADPKQQAHYFSRLAGKLIFHLGKQKDYLGRGDSYDSDLTKLSYYGVYATLLYNWEHIPPKDRLALLVAVVKLLRVLADCLEERFCIYEESLRSFLKFALVADAPVLAEVGRICAEPDELTAWRATHDFIHGHLEAFEAGAIAPTNTAIASLIASVNLNKDFPKLFSIFYWLWKLEFPSRYYAEPFRATFARFKAVYHDGADLRDLINSAYYVSKFDRTCLKDPFLANALRRRFADSILRLTLMDCYQLAHVAFNYFKLFGADCAREVAPMLCTLIANVDCMLSRIGAGAQGHPHPLADAPRDPAFGAYGLVPSCGADRAHELGQLPYSRFYNNRAENAERHTLTDYEALSALCAEVWGTRECLDDFLRARTAADDSRPRLYKLRVIRGCLEDVAPALGALEPYCSQLTRRIADLCA